MKTLLDDPDARVVQMGELILVDWRGPVRLAAVDVVGVALRSAPPASVSLFMMVREACGVPSANVRQHIKATMNAAADHIAAHATVIEGAGIAASAARTAINAMRAVVRKSYHERTFADAREALDWLEATSPGRSWTCYDALGVLGPVPSPPPRS